MTTIYIKRDFVRQFKIEEDLSLNDIHKKQPYPNIRSGWTVADEVYTNYMWSLCRRLCPLYARTLIMHLIILMTMMFATWR